MEIKVDYTWIYLVMLKRKNKKIRENGSKFKFRFMLRIK